MCATVCRKNKIPRFETLNRFSSEFNNSPFVLLSSTVSDTNGFYCQLPSGSVEVIEASLQEIRSHKIDCIPALCMKRLPRRGVQSCTMDHCGKDNSRYPDIESGGILIPTRARNILKNRQHLRGSHSLPVK